MMTVSLLSSYVTVQLLHKLSYDYVNFMFWHFVYLYSHTDEDLLEEEEVEIARGSH